MYLKSDTTAVLTLNLLRKVLLSARELVARCLAIKSFSLLNAWLGVTEKKSSECIFQCSVISEVNQNRSVHG